MKLHLIIGPMFSGKTSYIINKFNHNDSIAIKPSLDNRYSSNKITSHNNKSISCLSVKKLLNINKKLHLTNYKNIIIDEGQFFDDIQEFIETMENDDIVIYISALNGDFNRKPFKSITNLYSRADKIIFQQGKCSYCSQPSSFSLKTNLNNFCQIDVGGSDKYQPVCGNCYQDFLKKPVSHKLLQNLN